MPLVYGNAASALGLAPPNIATYQSTMFGLMLRNVATTGWVLTDPSGKSVAAGGDRRVAFLSGQHDRYDTELRLQLDA